MPKKSPVGPKEFIRKMENGEIDSSMVIYVTTEGDRVYLHPFDTEISALEFLETMVAGLRADVMESIMKRSLN